VRFAALETMSHHDQRVPRTISGWNVQFKLDASTHVAASVLDDLHPHAPTRQNRHTHTPHHGRKGAKKFATTLFPQSSCSVLFFPLVADFPEDPIVFADRNVEARSHPITS